MPSSAWPNNNCNKVIGKRDLSTRGKSNEAAYLLINESLDHGNFL